MQAACGSSQQAAVQPLINQAAYAATQLAGSLQGAELCLLEADAASALGEPARCAELCAEAAAVINKSSGHIAANLDQQVQWRAAQCSDRSAATHLICVCESVARRVDDARQLLLDGQLHDSYGKAKLRSCVALEPGAAGAAVTDLPDTSKLTVAQLKAQLKKHGLSTAGNKAPLANRLADHLRQQSTQQPTQQVTVLLQLPKSAADATG